MRANDARVAWQHELRRRAEAEEAAAKKAAQEAADAAADFGGMGAPPPAQVAPIVPQRVVSGGSAKQGAQVRVGVADVVEGEGAALVAAPARVARTEGLP